MGGKSTGHRDEPDEDVNIQPTKTTVEQANQESYDIQKVADYVTPQELSVLFEALRQQIRKLADVDLQTDHGLLVS